MLPRINSLIDIRDFFLLLYQDEKDNNNYYKNSNFVVTKGRGYISERKRIIEYFLDPKRERTWDSKVIERHFFHALNLIGISASMEGKWLVNKDLLKKIANISEGLGSPLNDKEKSFFKQQLFDREIRKNQRLVITISNDVPYETRWMDLYEKIFYQPDEKLLVELKQRSIPFEKHISIEELPLVRLSRIENIIKGELKAEEENSQSQSCKREVSTFTSWNLELGIINKIPKIIAKRAFGFSKVLFHEVRSFNDQIKFNQVLKEMYKFLLLKEKTVLIPSLKCLTKITLSLSNQDYDKFFANLRKQYRTIISLSPTSPAYFQKKEWQILQKWIYKEKGINYLTIRIEGVL